MRPETTDDLDDLVEDVANVVAWEYDAVSNTARVFVTEKKPVDELADGDLIADVLADVECDTDVVAVGGEFRPEVVDERFDPGFEPASAPSKDRHRPTPDGVSEINAKSTAATGGYFEAEVADPGRAVWQGFVEPGDVVRLSNNHVYARSNEADLGEVIVQPSPRDGGTVGGDVVGQLVGYVPVDDGVRVDIAARTTSANDSTAKHDLPDRMGTGVFRGDYAALRGEEVTKTGRTTGVSSGRVIATSTTVNVRYPDGQIKVRDCLLTTGMSQGGDSGSDVFKKSTGEYVGALFAGSPTTTIVCKAVNIEEDLGVQLQAHDGDVGDDRDDLLTKLLKWLFGLFD